MLDLQGWFFFSGSQLKCPPVFPLVPCFQAGMTGGIFEAGVVGSAFYSQLAAGGGL